MTIRDKLERGLKPGAEYRKDNLPEFQKDDPACETGAREDDSPEAKRAREACDHPPRQVVERAREKGRET